MFSRILVLILILSAKILCADFFSAFKFFSSDIYSAQDIVYSTEIKDSGWNRIFDIYDELFRYRLKKDTDTEVLIEKIEILIEDIEDDDIKDLKMYERDLITAFLYGSIAYIQSVEPSYSMFSPVKKARKLFQKLSSEYNRPDSDFGTALTDIALGMYLQDSFWIRTVLGYKGNIQKGLRHLDEIAFKDCITQTEANLFLIEYYADILQDHRRSIKYSQNLISNHPESKYFTYLYARDLYHTGKVKESYMFLKKLNDDIGKEYFGFEYSSVIYEAKCMYISGSADKGVEILKYAEIIHKGYLTEKFRNEWLFSVRSRQEIIYRPENFSGDNFDLSDDELERKAAIYFDHGYFRETARAVSNIKNRNPESYLLDLRAAVNMSDFEKADKIVRYMEDNSSSYFKKHKDALRISILNNIINNYLETANE
ncbi:MAG: hypothetical protein RBS89_05465 [Candidatus Delongbacteria bacterium]|jgi:hypothetical protein|nr:hypothetical protein [Candidatus Delongbacteria bacterium]